MIRPAPGVVFTTAGDGDVRHDPAARRRVTDSEWAVVHQVHGSTVVDVTGPGPHGDADAIVTSTPGLPLAVFTADCLGIVLHGPGAVGVVHAGWRGIVTGVIEAAVERLGEVRSVHIGPHIRSCCFEVGPEVAERFPDDVAETTWGTVSVDLAAAAARRLPVAPEVVAVCTRCGEDTFSHRRDGTAARQAAVGWVA